MRPLKQSEYSTELVSVGSPDCVSKINEIIAGRISADANDANKESLEAKYDPLDAQSLYQFWSAHDSDGLRNYLMKRLETRPRDVISFLAAVLGVTQGEPTIEELTMIKDMDWYETINRMVPAQTVMKALATTFPDRTTLLTPTRKMTTEERIAKWFIQHHEQSSASAKEQNEAQSRAASDDSTHS